MKKKVYAYIHTHWDREWYREFEEFRIRLIEVFEDVLQKLHSGTLDCFYFDGQTAALEDFLEIYPERKCEVEKLIAQKKLYIGPYYCSTDSLLVDRESLIRNLQYGINYSRHFGCKDFIAYHADTFGHSKDMPKIVNYFNIDYGIFWRGCGCNPSEFNFNGLNTTYLIEGYFHDELSQNVSYDQKASGIKRTLDRIAKYSSANLLLPLGADHLAAAENIKEQIAQVNKYLDDYEIVLSEPFEYFEQVRDNFQKYVSDEQRSRERNFILPGVYSSRIDLKQKNTKAQWLLTKKIEPLQALTSYLSRTRNYQREIDYAYAFSKPIIITFDDAYIDVYNNAFPILQTYNFKANIFVITGSIGNNLYMNEEMIKDVDKSNLIEIGSHTISHYKLAEKDAETIEKELKESKEVLEKILNKEVNTIAYPSGSFNSTVIEIAKKYYSYGLSTLIGKEQSNNINYYTLKRHYIYREYSLNDFIKIL